MNTKRRLTRALLALGLAGGLILGTAASASASGFGLNLQTDNRTDIVAGL
jgi:hypothetical protein